MKNHKLMLIPMHKAKIIASFIEILPEAIGRFFVRNTFASNSLSSISFTIHPADLIKTDPKKIGSNKKNNYLNLMKNHRPMLNPMHTAKKEA